MMSTDMKFALSFSDIAVEVNKLALLAHGLS